MTKWIFAETEKPFARQVIEKFTNEKGFVEYDKLQTEGSEIWQKLVIDAGRDHKQFQQSLSKIRVEMGRALPQYGGHRKGKKSESNGETIKRKYSKRQISTEIPQTKQEWLVSYCPHCGTNLNPVNLALNIANNYEKA